MSKRTTKDNAMLEIVEQNELAQAAI